MTEDELVALMRAWDNLDTSIQRVETALPTQLSVAVTKLSAERLAFRKQMQTVMRRGAAQPAK
jgi:uncharacterized protein YdcH (DUF465 family)